MLSCVGLALVSAPFAAQAQSTRQFAYVASEEGDSVTVIDTEAEAMVKTIAVGDGPFGVRLTPDSRWIWVPNFLDATISIIDAESQAVVSTVPLAAGSGPLRLAFDDEGATAYVVLANQHAVAVIDTALARTAPEFSLETTIPLATQPLGIDLSPSALLYVSGPEPGGGRLTEIDPSTGTAGTTIGVAGDPVAVAFTSDGAFGYAAAAGRISVVDLSRRIEVATIVFGVEGGTTQNNQDIVMAPGDEHAYVTNTARSAVGVIDVEANQIEASIAVAGARGIALEADGTRAWVSQDVGSVSVIDLAAREIVATVDIGGVLGLLAIVPPSGAPPTPTVTPTATAEPTATAASGGGDGGCAAGGRGSRGIGLLALALLPLLSPALRRRR
jgi:YVTN family beta-propeller protein